MGQSKQFKPERNDVLPAGLPPKNYRTFLTQVGGTNPYGEPRYRLVIADYVRIWRGGVWHDWPKNTTLTDQGGLVFSDERRLVETVVGDAVGGKHLITAEVPAEIMVSAQQPLRIVREMRWIRRYPHLRGWVLQHWDPPYLYGNRIGWESHRVPGAEDLLVLGEFPSRGAYELSCEWYDVTQKQFHRLPGLPEIPPLGLLERSIQQREASLQESVSANPEWRVLTRMMEWQEQQLAEEQREKEMLQKYYRDIMKPYMASSLEAGRLREQLADRMRARGILMPHVGN